MQARHVIESPNSFIVTPYQPGLLIDFTTSAKNSDLDMLRMAARDELASAESLQRSIDIVDELFIPLGISEAKGDFAVSLCEFAGVTDVATALDVALNKFGLLESLDGASSFVEKIDATFRETKVLQKAENFPTRLYCHIPGEKTELPDDGTHFGFVMSGDDMVLEFSDGYQYRLRNQSYFCAPGRCNIIGNGEVEIITRQGYRGLCNIGGRIEPWGRLQYIDGCTDTLLIPPVRRGDPCLNTLYFPPNTCQTAHTHPSLRAGLVIGGKGVCKTPAVDHDLLPGYIFFLPPETWHSFHTAEKDSEDLAALTVLAYHPDTDTGPTDEDHPMLNRTYFRFMHRLVSRGR